MLKKIKISTKLITGYAVIVALMGMLGVASSFVARNALKDEIGKATSLAASETLSRIDRNIYDRFEMVHQYASDLVLQQAVEKSNQEFEKMSDREDYIIRQEANWLVTPKGEISPLMQKLMSNELAGELKSIINFYEKEYSYKVFAEIFVTNKYGVNIAQSGRTTDYIQRDEKWWQLAKDRGFYITDLEYDKSAEVYSIDISVSLHDGSGNFEGVIKAVLNVEEIFHGMMLAEEEDVYFRLIKKNGEMIYSSKGGTSFFSKIFPSIYLGKIKEKEPYYIIPGPGDEKIMLTYVYSRGYREFDGFGWMLLVARKASDILAPVDILQRNIVIIVFGMMGIAVTIGLITARSISVPITQLKAAVNQIGQGMVDAKIEIDSNDEIGDLAISFKKMVKDLVRANDAQHTALNSEKYKAKELEDLKNKLDMLVVERTKELEEKIKQLNRSQKAMLYMVEDLNRTSRDLKNAQDQVIRSEKLAIIGKLAGIMSHEIRNPLGVIRNAIYFLSMKLKDKMDEKVKKHINILEEEINAADRIIADVLNFSRLRPLDLKEKDINNEISSAMKMATIPDVITVEKKLNKNLSSVLLDSFQMRQVFFNLISNSVQAMASGGVLTITTRNVGDDVAIIFKDTGYGISSENLDKVFEPLFSTKAVGVGLGLTTCATIIKAHHGIIKAESKPGEGTSITIRMPIKKQQNKGG